MNIPNTATICAFFKFYDWIGLEEEQESRTGAFFVYFVQGVLVFIMFCPLDSPMSIFIAYQNYGGLAKDKFGYLLRRGMIRIYIH